MMTYCDPIILSYVGANLALAMLAPEVIFKIGLLITHIGIVFFLAVISLADNLL